MYNTASAVTGRSLAIVRSRPLPGCEDTKGESNNVTVIHHKREPRGQPFLSSSVFALRFAIFAWFSVFKMKRKIVSLLHLYRGSYMSAHVLLNLLNELGKRDKMRGLSSILSLFRNEFNKFNNTRARMLDSVYHMTNSLKSHFWRKNVMILSSCTQRCYGRNNVSRKSINH